MHAFCHGCMQNGIFLAHKIQQMGLLTLPDLFKRKYGKLMEVSAGPCMHAWCPPACV